MKKIIIIIFSFFFFIEFIQSRTVKTENYQARIKNQLRGSISSTIKILKEIEKAELNYGNNSIVYKEAVKNLKTKKSRSNFVVWYYNYLTMIENDPYLPEKEKEIKKDLILKEASRTCQKEWLDRVKKNKVDKEFLEYYLMTDRFVNLILWVYEKYDSDTKTTENFLNSALTDPDPLNYILKDLNENIKLVSIRTHRIKPGETLGGLFGNKWKKIAAYNKIKDPTKLRPGTIIQIPDQPINIPKDVDKVTQLCVLAAEQLVESPKEKITIAEVTLAVLRVETNEGRIIGTATYHRAMNPEEKLNFLKLCQKLGLDPETTPVSNKPSYGWGGAMGPGQFLPSTWLAYEADVCLMTNQKFVSPYNLKHAICAIASKLVASGVASGGSDAKQRAVMRYFAGTNWDKAEYQFYWKKVKKELEKINQNQEIINLILTEEKKVNRKKSTK